MAEEDSVSEEFPTGMKVMAVDNDGVSLKMLRGLLRYCGYSVTATMDADTALNLLKESRGSYDLLIADVTTPLVHGFGLLQYVQREMDHIPVILTSASDDDKEAVKKGVLLGARDYLVKPLRLDTVKVIWQHVLLAKKAVGFKRRQSDGDHGGAGVAAGGSDEVGTAPQSTEASPAKTQRKHKRVAWDDDLQAKFVDAFNHLGYCNAAPSRILKLMNVPWLNRQHVASHLQKYRMKQGIEERQRYRLPYLREDNRSPTLWSPINQIIQNSATGSAASMSVTPRPVKVQTMPYPWDSGATSLHCTSSHIYGSCSRRPPFFHGGGASACHLPSSLGYLSNQRDEVALPSFGSTSQSGHEAIGTANMAPDTIAAPLANEIEAPQVGEIVEIGTVSPAEKLEETMELPPR